MDLELGREVVLDERQERLAHVGAHARRRSLQVRHNRDNDRAALRLQAAEDQQAERVHFHLARHGQHDVVGNLTTTCVPGGLRRGRSDCVRGRLPFFASYSYSSAASSPGTTATSSSGQTAPTFVASRMS